MSSSRFSAETKVRLVVSGTVVFFNEKKQQKKQGGLLVLLKMTQMSRTYRFGSPYSLYVAVYV